MICLSRLKRVNNPRLALCWLQLQVVSQISSQISCLLLNRFVPGGIAGLLGGLGGASDGAPQQSNGNHSDNAPKFKF